MIGIYKIQSLIKPNRIYIGSAVDLMNRWRCHLSDLKFKKHRNAKLQRHYNKYGISDLQFSILIECEKDELLKIEQYFIDSQNPYFNICKIAGRTSGYKHPESVKKKMRIPKTEDHKKRLSEARLGKEPWNKGRRDLPSLSEEHKHKLSVAIVGKPQNKKSKLKVISKPSK